MRFQKLKQGVMLSHVAQIRCTSVDRGNINGIVDKRNIIAKEIGNPRHTQESVIHEMIEFWEKGHCPECDSELIFQNHKCTGSDL